MSIGNIIAFSLTGLMILGIFLFQWNRYKNYYYTCPKCNEDFEPKNFWASLWAWESDWACNPFGRGELTCTKCGDKNSVKYLKKKRGY